MRRILWTVQSCLLSLNISPRGPRDSQLEDLLNIQEQHQAPETSITIDECVEGDQATDIDLQTIEPSKSKVKEKKEKLIEVKPVTTRASNKNQ